MKRFVLTTVVGQLLRLEDAPALRFLDAVRWRVLRVLGAFGRRIVVERELRVGIGGALAVGMALTLTVLAPFWLLALGPILLGIPHLLADIRYLVVLPGLHRRRELLVACGLPILAVGWGASAAVGMAAILGAFVVARAPLRVRATGAGAAGLLILVATLWPGMFRLGLAHAHNLVAVGLWWAWRPRATRWHLLPLGMFGIASALLLSGVLEPWIASLSWIAGAPGGLGLQASLAQLVPGIAAPWGPRLVLVFAFAQSIHYAVWLRLVPDESRNRPTPRTFRASMRALVGDFGPGPLAVVLVACAALAVWAMVNLAQARDGYFSLALFHGYLELAAVSLLLAEGRVR